MDSDVEMSGEDNDSDFDLYSDGIIPSINNASHSRASTSGTGRPVSPDTNDDVRECSPYVVHNNDPTLRETHQRLINNILAPVEESEADLQVEWNRSGQKPDPFVRYEHRECYQQYTRPEFCIGP